MLIVLVSPRGSFYLNNVISSQYKIRVCLPYIFMYIVFSVNTTHLALLNTQAAIMLAVVWLSTTISFIYVYVCAYVSSHVNTFYIVHTVSHWILYYYCELNSIDYIVVCVYSYITILLFSHSEYL